MTIDIAALDASILSVVGQTVTYTPDGGAPIQITGFFQDAGEHVALGELEVELQGPTLCVLVADVPVVTHQDFTIINGTTYRVKRIVRDEGAMSYLLLEKQ